MKCPKCGFISFDYNQVCPKCNRDISQQQNELSLPTFRANPPSLLGVLIGEINESDVGIRIDKISEVASSDVEMSFGEEPELGVSLDREDSIEVGEEDEAEIAFEDEKISLDSEDISLDLDDLSTEEPESEEVAAPEAAGDDEELDLDFDEISFEDFEEEEAIDEEKITLEEREDQAVELDAMSMETDKATGDEIGDEIEISLDDLSIADAESEEMSLEDAMNIDRTVLHKQAELQRSPYDASEMITMEMDKRDMKILEEEEAPKLDLDVEESEDKS